MWLLGVGLLSLRSTRREKREGGREVKGREGWGREGVWKEGRGEEERGVRGGVGGGGEGEGRVREERNKRWKEERGKEEYSIPVGSIVVAVAVPVASLGCPGVAGEQTAAADAAGLCGHGPPVPWNLLVRGRGYTGGSKGGRGGGGGGGGREKVMRDGERGRVEIGEGERKGGDRRGREEG